MRRGAVKGIDDGRGCTEYRVRSTQYRGTNDGRSHLPRTAYSVLRTGYLVLRTPHPFRLTPRTDPKRQPAAAGPPVRMGGWGNWVGAGAAAGAAEGENSGNVLAYTACRVAARRCMVSHSRRQQSRSRSMASVNTAMVAGSSAHCSCCWQAVIWPS